MSIAAQAKARRKAYRVARQHGRNYTERRAMVGASGLGSAVSAFTGLSKTAKKSGGGR